MVLVALGALAGCAPPGERRWADGFVPNEVRGWKAEGPDGTYDRETIYDYIDGAGEVYLQYGFRSVLVRGFAREGQPRISVQLFDMGTPAEAFGIFSFEREGESIGIGQDSEYEGGLLRFWKGRWFASVSAESETDEARQAIRSLGEAIASALPERGDPPRLIEALPAEGLAQLTVRYFHGPFVLAYHAALPEKDRLGLGPETDAVLASYRLKEGRTRLLLVLHRDARRAGEAYEAYLDGVRAETAPASTAEAAGASRGAADAGRETSDTQAEAYRGGEAFRREDGTCIAAAASGRVVAVVFAAPSCAAAEALLASATQRAEDAPWTR